MSNRSSIRQRLVQLCVAGALIVVAAGLAAALAYEHLVSSRSAVVYRIDPASVLVAELQTAYVDEETGVRGFVLTGEKLFLDPYTIGEAGVSASASSLDRLLPRGSKAATLLEAAETQGQAWMAQFAQPAVSATSRGDGRYSATATGTRHRPSASAPARSATSGSCPSKTLVSGSILGTPTEFSSSSSACRSETSPEEPESDWPWRRRSSSFTAAASGSILTTARGPGFHSPFRPPIDRRHDRPSRKSPAPDLRRPSCCGSAARQAERTPQ